MRRHARPRAPYRTRLGLAAAASLAILVGCGNGAGETSPRAPLPPAPGPVAGGGSDVTPVGGGAPVPSVTATDFALRTTGAAAPVVLIEGDPEGVTVPLALERSNGHAARVTLSLGGATDADVAFVNGGLSEVTLDAGSDRSEAILRLDIADRPLLAQQRRFIVTATDGRTTARTEIVVDVQPVDAPDVYLLLGQSNMVGFSGVGTRRAAEGDLDAVDPRALQLNVTANSSGDAPGRFTSAADYVTPAANVVSPPLAIAADPLHEPSRDGGISPKGGEGIGMGLSFAKRALESTSRAVVLVPAAWSGSSFCANENGALGHWNARPTDDPALGNTWLFDRAVLRADLALAASGGILRGILWHQGESDANEVCAERYAANLALLARELRTRIAPDRRGATLRTADAPIPFVVGTMSRGVDERGDFSTFSAPKQRIDDVHRRIGELVVHAAVSDNDDLVPANGYPCGGQDCLHFGAEALREMGRRYHDALTRALEP